MYRFSDDMINETALDEVFRIVSDKSLKDLQLQNYIIVLSRYLIRLKLEQQKITSLSLTNNKTIKDSPKTLISIKKSFESYEKLIVGANKIITALKTVNIDEEKEVESKKQINTFKELVFQYSNDKTRLNKLIEDLESYQASLVKDEVVKIEPKNNTVSSSNTNQYLYIIFAILILIIIGIFLMRKKEHTNE